jgi:hypothetical protein
MDATNQSQFRAPSLAAATKYAGAEAPSPVIPMRHPTARSGTMASGSGGQSTATNTQPIPI